MIAIDSSALMAIVLNESDADACAKALASAASRIISAAVLTEVLIVAESRNLRPAVQALIDQLDFNVIAITRSTAEQAVMAYDRWGKGRHKAALNIMDCFSYALARENNCPLLFIGNDFSQTDIESAL
ncbi:type II toxin-antitoxin system VapC family toxin [Asticcacaulis taihuensis]|uniref:type II toxin-antitoxin system VapC family toxin n=1 Tax=Asticcacaulis taihuensis TaxID=260084 RepID=UPI003F7B4ABC